jgi:uncharacterized membrane protein YedE/YeeE
MKQALVELYQTVFGKAWKMWQGAIIVAVLTIGLFLIWNPWTTVGFVILGQHMYHTLGLPLTESAPGSIDFLHNPFGMMWLMMIWGAFGSSLMAKEFALRVPSKADLLRGLIGGLLIGIGFILATGCTAGAFFNGWPAMSAGALMFGLGLFIGSFLAVRYNVWEVNKFPHWSEGTGKTYLKPKKKGSAMPMAGLTVIIIGGMLALLYDPNTMYDVGSNVTGKVLTGFVIIGLLIGIALQRSGFCITRAFREPWLTGDAQSTIDIMAGMIVALFGFAVIKGMVLRDGIEMTFVTATYFIPGLVGGIIFGFGMVLNGGCTVGSLRGAGDGFVKFWFAVLGMIISAPLTAEYILPGFLSILPGWTKQALFLPQAQIAGHPLGYAGSVGLILLIFLAWYVFVKWNQRTNKCSAF